MRFALCAAADRHRGVLEAFLNAGWTPTKLSTPTDERIDFNRTLVGRANPDRPDAFARSVSSQVDAARRGAAAAAAIGYRARPTAPCADGNPRQSRREIWDF
jgi:hypothetical protein